MADLPPVSVVVPTYRRRRLLPQVLHPLLDDPATLEVVVVVDGARDGSFEYLRERARGDPRIAPVLIENRGEAGARQEGVERARGDVVLLLDDDVVAGPGLVTGHARAHGRAERVLVLGYMPVPVGGVATRDALVRLYAREYEEACREFEDDPREVLRGLWAGNFSLRRRDALDVGLTSGDASGRYPYHQDLQFGLRCLRAGLTGRFDRDLVAEHRYTRTLDAFLRDAWHQGYAQVHLHDDFGELLGPLDVRAQEARLGATVRLLARIAAPEPVGALEEAGLRRLAAAAGRLHLAKVEIGAIVALRRIEQRAGMRAARAGERAR